MSSLNGLEQKILSQPVSLWLRGTPRIKPGDPPLTWVPLTAPGPFLTRLSKQGPSRSTQPIEAILGIEPTCWASVLGHEATSGPCEPPFPLSSVH